MKLKDIFDHYADNEGHKFERVQNKLSKRPDIHAFMLLDKIIPGERDIVACAEHDQIWIGVDIEMLEKVVSEEQILELIRCGVRLDKSVDSLSMFV